MRFVNRGEGITSTLFSFKRGIMTTGGITSTLLLIFSVDVIPLLLVDAIPRLGGIILTPHVFVVNFIMYLN